MPTTSTTLEDILAGWLPDGQRRGAADAALKALIVLPVSTTREELLVWWTPEVALELSVLDSKGPRCDAVAWFSRALGDVLRSAYLRDPDMTIATREKPRRLMDGYDYIATVPRGTSLLVESSRSSSGRVWQLARDGVPCNADGNMLLHGARPARVPDDVAASRRIHTELKMTLWGSEKMPSEVVNPIAIWHDAPHVRGSFVSMAELHVYADGWIRAIRTVRDDVPRIGTHFLRARELRALIHDIERAPRCVSLPRVEVRERVVRIEADDPRIDVARTIPGARPCSITRVYAGEEGCTAAVRTIGARLLGSGGPVAIPSPGSAWEVPVTAWRGKP